ncbi:non-ribosomal peptide synthase/amino acid adenylation enzyme [Mycobacteroides abscessus subsp. abscessus]|uniref:non-ribosomal peptide synthetase n=1 Tax=Mycobacteroides abscessus TaxID=36809 RepID=UPI0005DD0182|nr:non-ribosomal peptide synthetase [Mycobacteroides abscessus]CPV55666.1 non-ribosomal peptide synthase/amino acid adenylation enzyme [Mycobacteroides abscessus]SHQ64034.1 non-ribosomal peptide synthase/amino acid adenylation enzyme [Mycobacteroides abscessus subsp. abscessus]SHR33340.1 non-ribosomal peptide synthase/amino acid adenylation enzyme [Mycobacteroides abscessus subsp. abscessus]SHZ30672.1 non-ribosomal peptide synthase/amino acid adenylation enzyme [Mycobacteroides abscessus subsp.
MTDVEYDADLARRIAALPPDRRALFEQKIRERASAPGRLHRASTGEPAPPSYGQQRMWVLHELAPTSGNYATSAQITGPLHLAALRAALNHVVSRHEVLRTSFHFNGEELVTSVAPAASAAVALVDLRGVTVAPARLDRLLIQESHRPFDLTGVPLLRATVFRLAPQEHLVVLVIHHIATDGWSNAILINEISAYYRELTAGGPAHLPPLGLQYGDYAAWQRHRLHGPELAALHSYWTKRLGDAAYLELPADHPRHGPQLGAGANHSIVLAPETAASLMKLMQSQGGSLFMLVLTALTAVLRIVTGQRDVVVGTLVAGRSRVELEQLIGYFVNVVPLRFWVDEQISFRELWQQVRGEVLNALAHQELPYEELLKLIGRDGRGGTQPLLRVACVAHRTPPQLELAGLSVRLREISMITTEFDLMVEIQEDAAGLRIGFQYDRELFDADTVHLLAGHVRDMLQRAARDPDGLCTQLLAPAAPLPAAPGLPEGTVHGCIEEVAQRTPDALALCGTGTWISYRELNGRANRLARRLRALGVRPDMAVAVLLPRSADAVIAMLAVLKAGAAYLPLDPAHPAARRAQILADTAPVCLITGLDAPDVTGYRGQVLSLPQVFAQPPADRALAADLRLPVRPDGLAYVLHTSGSTGKPKGVLGIHRGAVNRVRWMQESYPFAPGEVCAARTALGFVDSVWETFGPLAAGVPLVILSADDVAVPARLIDQLARQRVTRLVAVPSLLSMLLDEVPDLAQRLPLLRLWIVSGEMLTDVLARRFHEQVPDRILLNLYGSSEVSADATAAEIDCAVAARPAIGAAITGVTARVGDQGLRTLPPLAPGEIYVGGQCLARGYHGRPGETAAVFVPDPAGPPGARVFCTGDGGRVRASGELDYLGRLDGQLQVRGHRIEPGEVERALLAHPDLRAAAVTAYEDPQSGATLVGYVVAHRAVAPAELRHFLRTRLPGYMVPDLFAELAELPSTASGKVDRRRLPRPDALAASDTRAPAAPRTPAEAIIAGIFTELLPGHPPAGPHDDFFSLGGHSVLAARVTARIREQCGVSVKLRDLFAAPTVSALAARVGRAGGSPGPAQPAGARALSPRWEALHEPFPLTDVQQAYYVGRDSSLQSGSVATHAYLELSTGTLNIGRFQDALRAVIAQHPMLRAVVNPDGSQQILAHVPPYQIAVYDLRESPEGEEAAALAQTRAEMSHQVLPADRWPLFDVRVSQLRAGALIHVSVDALVCDAYSFGLVMTELGTRYRNAELELPPVPVSFRDYVLAERARRESPEYAAALEYWRERLATLPGGPDLPMAVPAASATTPRFERRSGRLTRAQWSVLKERAAGAGLTPSGLLLAAFAEILTAWSGSSRYSLMLTVFQRDPVHPDVDRIVGDFTSLSLFEVDHAGNEPFITRARAIQQRLWDDLDHAMVSCVTALRDRAAREGGPLAAVTPIVFTSNLPVTGGPALATGDWRLGEQVYGITQTPQVHLDHQIAESGGELLFDWDAVESVFAPGVLDAMFAAYRDRLLYLANDQSAWDRPVTVPLPAAQQAVRCAVNNTAAAPAQARLHDAVFAAAAQFPDHVAIVDGDMRMTYRHLVRRVHRLARDLRSRDVRVGELVAVAATKGWQQLVAALAVVDSGAAFVPVDPDLPASRQAQLIDSAQARIVCTQASCLGALPVPDGLQVIVIDHSQDDQDGDDGGDPVGPLEGGAGLESLAYVIFTSGSTGEPKGVMIDHRGAVNTIECVNRRLGVGPVDRVLAVSSLSFDLAIYDLFGVLAAGGTVVLPSHSRRRDPAHWAALIAAEGVTLWNSVPALADVLADYAAALAPQQLRTLRAVLLSGDWIPLTLPDRIRQLAPGAGVMSLGGATEGSIWSVWYPVGDVDPGWRSIPYGVPMDNQSMHVLDDALAPRPNLVPGDLYIGGVGVALGYWRDPQRTARSFLVHPVTAERLYRTGDRARYRSDGVLEFLGREDDQVKISGFRVELGEIEAALDRLPGVRASAVIAIGPRTGDKRLIGYVAGDGLDPADVREQLTALLPHYLVPRIVHVLDRLPLTGNGKIDRGALIGRAEHELQQQSPEVSGSDAGTLSALQAVIAQVWQQVLEAEQIGAHDNFFELGGTSLQAIRLLTLVQQATGIRVPLARLLEAPTASELADVVARQRERGGVRLDNLPVVRPDPAGRYEPFPLTDVQQAYWLGRTASTLGGVATHFYTELDVEDLDPVRLEIAIDRLVARHEALRMIVRPDGRQQVLAGVPHYRVIHQDVSTLPAAAAQERLDDVRHEMSHAVHDAAQWPLFAMRTSRLDEVWVRLHLSLDLLIVDAHSTRVLTGELLAYYDDPDTELPELTLSFRDYVCAVTAARDTDVYRQARRYWADRLPELPPAPALPLRRFPEELATPRFERLVAELPPQDWSALRTLAGGVALTPSALLCAAYAQVLGMWSATGRFTLNLTTFNRLPIHPQVEALVGDFTTTTLLAVDGTDGPVLELALRIQAQIWRDLEHWAVSGVEVLRMLRADPQRRADALMPVVFTSALGGGDPPTPRAAWRVREGFAVSQTPQVLLDHQVGEKAGTLICNWDYVPDAFPPGVVEAMFAAFTHTLDVLVAEAKNTKGGQQS